MTTNALLAAQPAEEAVSETPWALVIHHSPDFDAWACAWAATRKAVPKGVESQVIFVGAGERLPKEIEDQFGTVLYMDTGGGDLDQHGKGLVRYSSLLLLAEKYGFDKDPGMKPIIELACATDNVERVPRTSIHYYFKSLRHSLRDPKTNEVDWEAARGRVFEVLDGIYGLWSSAANAQALYRKVARESRLENGVNLSFLPSRPYLRDAAYDNDMDVVICTERSGDSFGVVIQMNRHAHRSLTLHDAITALRNAEAKKRGIAITPEQAAHVGPAIGNPVPGWHLHDSGRLITCSSRAHRLEGDEFTRLSSNEIVSIVRRELSKFRFPKR